MSRKNNINFEGVSTPIRLGIDNISEEIYVYHKFTGVLLHQMSFSKFLEFLACEGLILDEHYDLF